MVCLDTRTPRVVSCRHQPTNPASLSDDSIRAVLADRKGTQWVGTKAGLDRLNERTGQFDHVTISGMDGIIGFYERPRVNY